MEEIPNLSDLPFGRDVQESVRNLHRKAAGEFISNFKKALPTATELFFRCEIGERHLDSVAFHGGSLVWIIGVFGSTVIGSVPSLVAWFTGHSHLALVGHAVSFLVSGRLWLVYCALGRKNAEWIAALRLTRKPYHSRSPGRLRWGDDPVQNSRIRLRTIVGLLLFAPFSGVIFLLSLRASALKAGQQQAVIYGKYLDELDAKLEHQFMRKAILGECPVEMTYLYGPFMPELPQDVREDVADVYTQGEMKSVGKRPVATSSVSQSRNAQSTKSEISVDSQEKPSQPTPNIPWTVNARPRVEPTEENCKTNPIFQNILLKIEGFRIQKKAQYIIDCLMSDEPFPWVIKLRQRFGTPARMDWIWEWLLPIVLAILSIGAAYGLYGFLHHR